MSDSHSEGLLGAASGDFEELVERARQGSGDALRALYDSLSTEVAGFLRVRGAADVGAATNEVFHRAFTALHRFSGTESGFRSWIFTIANNLLIDEHRKRVRRPQLGAGLDSAGHEVAGGDVEDEAMARLTHADIGRLLDGLTPGQRDVLHLRLIAGLTLSETAAVLGRPVGAVKSLQHRAIAALRDKLDAGAYPLTPSLRSQR